MDQGKDKTQKKAAKKKDQAKDQDLSIEDKELKEKIEHYCEQLQQNDFKALECLIEIVKSATKTMTSVPKPFKFLKTFYKSLTDHFSTVADSPNKKLYADFLSVLSMIFGEKGTRSSLYYLLQGNPTEFTSWGHEYVSNLASDIGKEYELRIQNNEPYDGLISLVDQIVPYFIQNNAEHDSIDLLLIVDKLEDIQQYVTETNFEKIHMYLSAVCGYCTDQDELVKTLTILYDMALKLEQYTIAFKMAIKLDDSNKIKNVFQVCPDELIKKQLAFNAARQKIFIPDLGEEIDNIISNKLLAGFYIDLAKDLEVYEPKHPRDVFKVHLEENYRGGGNKDIISLENIYVNAFVNAGINKDTYIIEDDEDESKKSFVLKLDGKEEWQTAAVASLGLLCPWNSEIINEMLMPYIDNEGKFIKAGACLAIGLCSAGINDENSLAFGLLTESADNGPAIIKQCSILGLGMAYAGRPNAQLQENFIPKIVDTSLTLQESAFAALALGLSNVGQCDEDIAGAIIQTLMERIEEAEISSHFTKYFGLGLALLYMGQQNKCEPTLMALEVIGHPIKKFISIMVVSCAYIGSGNVLKVQDMLHQCLSDEAHSEIAILGLSLIASSEEIGNEMAMRILNHILHFGKADKKKMVPLAFAVLSISNPKINVMDILFKLSYDPDTEIAQRAIMSLGLVGAGTNNSRLAQIFRKLASYYSKEPETILCIRLSQGLLYMGKGMLSIQPYYNEKFLLSKVAMSGVLVFLTSVIDIKSTILLKHHYLIYFLSLAMYPKSLFVLDEKLKPMPLNIRVGQIVDVVGQAGKPKKITGFQTHTSPVLISNGERAELASQEFIPIQESVLENFIILRKNPNYVEDERPRKKTSL